MIDVRVAHWSKRSDCRALKAIRYEVFVNEQQVPEAEEMDAFDETSMHLLASYVESGFIGCARIMPSGQIGRMAVLKNFRGRGVGSRLMQAAITQAKQHRFASLFLHAQCHAESFYAQFGFIACGEVFEEAGIRHVKMTLPANL